MWMDIKQGDVLFQSTHPVRGATVLDTDGGLMTDEFQSTHPVRGATQEAEETEDIRRNFNPRTP